MPSTHCLTFGWTTTFLVAVSTAVAVAGTQEPPPAPSAGHYQAAVAALAKDDAQEAEVELKLALQDDPLHADSHLLLATMLARRGELDQAAVGFRRTAAIDPTNPAALHNLGTVLLRRLEPVQAARLLERAVELRPEFVPSYNNLAKAYFLAGLPELALAAYEEALKLDPSNAIALESRKLLAESAGAEKAAAPPAVTAPPPAAINLDDGQDMLDDAEVATLRELVRDFSHVTVERRGDAVALCGWTSGPRERSVLDRILAQREHVIDLTTEDSGDPHRMIEVDAVLFVAVRLDSQTVGFNFLRLIELNFQFFASDHEKRGTSLAPPGAIEALTGFGQWAWLLNASVDYDVNIANAVDERVAVLARPHLTTVNGTPAEFLVGGEIVFEVSGINSGDIKPYPFGTSLSVTPTLLRTEDEDGRPRVHIVVKAARTSILEIVTAIDPDESVIFDKVEVTSEAVVGLGQTLVLSGLNQRESRGGNSGVPVLRSMPLLRSVFATKDKADADTAVIVLLTPRDPAFIDEQNRRQISEFVERRRAFVQAFAEGEEALRRFRERYPDWYQVAPSRFASHIFLMNHSQLYRAASGEDLATDALDFELLGSKPKWRRGRRWLE